MRWVENINDDLPAPRDDEPEALRQNIADELADHLQCALNHELHKTSDEIEAKQNTLNRFGNVQRIARKLWFDAMKEKIMTQRITLIFSALTAVACFVAVGLVWNMVSENRATNLAVMEQLKSLSASAVEVNPTEWSPIKIELVTEEQEAKPAEGFHIKLRGNIYEKEGNKISGTVERMTNKAGITDFGLFRPDSYQLLITAPWKETLVKEIAVPPGNSDPIKIICPTTAREQADVQISVDWPEDIKENGLWLVCDYCKRSREAGREKWYPFDDHGQFIVSPDGKLYEFNSDIYTSLRIEPGNRVTMNGKPLEAKENLQWPEGEYAMLLMTLTTADQVSSIDEPNNSILEYFCSYNFEPPFWSINNPAHGFSGSGFFSVSSIAVSEPGDPLPAPTLKVTPGKQNHWKLTLPGELLVDARKELSADKK